MRLGAWPRGVLPPSAQLGRACLQQPRVAYPGTSGSPSAKVLRFSGSCDHPDPALPYIYPICLASRTVHDENWLFRDVYLFTLMDLMRAPVQAPYRGGSPLGCHD